MNRYELELCKYDMLLIITVIIKADIEHFALHVSEISSSSVEMSLKNDGPWTINR